MYPIDWDPLEQAGARGEGLQLRLADVDVRSKFRFECPHFCRIKNPCPGGLAGGYTLTPPQAGGCKGILKYKCIMVWHVWMGFFFGVSMYVVCGCVDVCCVVLGEH